MSKRPLPSEENGFLYPHVTILRDSFRHWTGRDLVNPRLDERDAARFLFNASFAVASQDTGKDPLFNYANRTALNLFAMRWEEFTGTPSRLSAEPTKQAERERLLEKVSAKGFIDGYSGVRVGRHGRRFIIENAIVWNLVGPGGRPFLGQAAMFKRWKMLP
jgi:hypothetical protein